MRCTLPIIGLIVALSAVASMPAAAQWKWRDASGRVTVSDRPPPAGVPDRDILTRPAAPRAQPAAPAAAASAAEAASAAGPTAAAPAASSPADRELEARRKAADAQAKAKAKAEEDQRAAQRADNCSRARVQLATIESGQRISRVNARGEREILDDTQRAEEMRRARAVIASECR